MNRNTGLASVIIGLGALLLILFLIGRQQDIPDKSIVAVPVSEPELLLQLPVLSDADFDWIAARIYRNEAMSQPRYLTHWGEGEDFPSFGIGHFIWFPDGVDAPFDEMFPAMMAFVRDFRSNGTRLPDWMNKPAPFHAPWNNKQQFDQAFGSARMSELREWLEATAQLQARFVVATFTQRWHDLELPGDEKQVLSRQLQNLAGSARGLFAVIDYYNFKGLGVNPRERYQGEGWGLIQVLQTMAKSRAANGTCDDPVERFREAAAGRLSLRVELAPPERNESRWLEGWFARLQRYAELDSPTGKFAGPGFRVRPYLQNPNQRAVTLSWLSNDDTAGQVVVWKLGEDNAGNKVVDRAVDRADPPMLFESSPVLAGALSYHPAEAKNGIACTSPAAPYLHQLRLTALQSDTAYGYKVSQQNDHTTGVFRTSPGEDAPFRFIVYADSETEPESTGKHAAWPGRGGTQTARKYPVDQATGYRQNLQVINQRRPAFVAIAGDLVQSGGEQRDWDEFWAHNSKLAASTFIVPALGNHDYFGGPGLLGKYGTLDSERAVNKYKTYFDLPANGSDNVDLSERYYTLQYAGVTLIVLDGNDSQPHRSEFDTNWRLKGEGDGGFAPGWQQGSQQYHWLERELRRAQVSSLFTFVMFHGAPWTSGVHGQPPGERSGQDILSSQPLQALTPLFLTHGVDAVFGGHDEMYEHSIVPGFEILPDDTKHKHEVHFFDLGIGGDGLRGPVEGVQNPHRVFLADNNAPELYSSDGVLLDGGKHYGHLEVNIGQNAKGQWQARMDAVYVFPMMDAEGRVLGFERRLYDDSTTLNTRSDR